MLQQHPITPSIELVKQWSDRWHSAKDNDFDVVLFVAIEAARWGADQQLELDAKWLDHNALNEAHLKIAPMGEVLKEAMRPKPPSLKEQSLALIDKIQGNKEMWQTDELNDEMTADFELLRQAVLQLPD